MSETQKYEQSPLLYYLSLDTFKHDERLLHICEFKSLAVFFLKSITFLIIHLLKQMHLNQRGDMGQLFTVSVTRMLTRHSNNKKKLQSLSIIKESGCQFFQLKSASSHLDKKLAGHFSNSVVKSTARSPTPKHSQHILHLSWYILSVSL